MSTWKLDPVSNHAPKVWGIWKKRKSVRTRIAKSEEPNSNHTQRTTNLKKKSKQSFSIKIKN